MDRFWLKSYPQGVPADIDPSQYKSLIQLLDEAFKKYSDKPAYSFMGAEMTFGQLDEVRRRSVPGCRTAGWARASVSRS